MKKAIPALLKLAVSAAILFYLGRQAYYDDSFHELVTQPKRWDWLFVGAVATLVSILITFVRWWFLVRQFDLECTLRQACRLSSLGFLFNFFSLGVIGGDVLRAVSLARSNPGRRSASVASVFLDRFLGLYALFVVAMVGGWFLDLDRLQVRDPAELVAVRRLGQLSTLVAAAGAVGLAVVMAPWMTPAQWGRLVARLPVAGRMQDRIELSIDAFRRHKGVLVGSFLASIVVHVLNVVGIYYVACGLPGGQPTLGAHFIIAPLAILASLVPLPGGLGAVEYALDFLYRAMSAATVAPRQGFLVALAYRMVTMAIAALGLAYYLASRGEVRQLIAEAERAEEPEPASASSGATRAESVTVA